MKLHVLGTGHATVIKNYNTCFLIENNGQYFLVDGGGGNRIFSQLENAKLDINKIQNAFITHNHTDHLLGIIWVVRSVLQGFLKNERSLPFTLYGSKECLDAIKTISLISIGEKFWNANFGKKFFLREVKDGQVEKIAGLNFEFFDILTIEMPQMGFFIEEKKFAFCGDMPLNEKLYEKYTNVNWLCLEAFCLEKNRNKNLLPLTKHFTVEQAATTAQKLHPKNLILWHGDDNIDGHRKQQYTDAAQKIYDGNIIVPEDLETIIVK